jgi:peptidoglycan hydrolase-like protein with peptidoglycan-binding domain
LHRVASLLVVALWAAAAIFADTPAAKEREGTASKKAPSKAASSSKKPVASSKAGSSKTGSVKTSSVKTSSIKTSKPTKKTTTTAAAPRRSSQQHPTAERYKEIQQALADKGYLTGPVDGNWSQESADAMQRFQHDQNLAEDGKIGSLSLIALGLGPKRVASTDQLKESPQQPPEAPSSDKP